MSSPYLRLCAHTTPETVRNNPFTAAYSDRFVLLAKRHGLPIARAWLLGALLFDLDAQRHPSTPSLLAHHDHDVTPPPPQTPNSPRGRLQQHIESSARQLDINASPLYVDSTI